MPAVKQGDAATYTVSWTPSSMMGGQTAGQMTLTVNSVSGTLISTRVEMKSAGMQVSSDLSFDVAGSTAGVNLMSLIGMMNTQMSMGLNMSSMNTGMTALGMKSMSLFIAGGLNDGDYVFPGSSYMLNHTLFLMQTPRDVNMMQLYRTVNGQNFTMTTYWDRATGILTHSVVTQSSPAQSIQLTLSTTNLWGTADLTLIEIGLVAAVVAIGGVLAIRKWSARAQRVELKSNR